MILIIVADFYKDIAKELLDSAVSVLEHEKLKYEVITVPGCFEIPAVISIANKSAKYSGFIALGCVIRGETSHYDYVCGESARGINDLAIDYQLAVGYGIITAENGEQAYARSNPKGNKNVGKRAALACLAMLQVKSKLLTA